jgi:hypothetical protein
VLPATKYDQNQATHLSWTPDGKALIYPDAGIQQAALGDSEPTTVWSGQGFMLAGPVFVGSDGKIFYFQGQQGKGGGTDQLWSCPLDCKTPKQLTQVTQKLRGYTLAEFGTSLYYSVSRGSDPSGDTDVYALNLINNVTGRMLTAKNVSDITTPLISGTACPELQFVGVRGSGEVQSQDGGLAPTVAAVKTVMARLVPNMGVEAINYKAVPLPPFNNAAALHDFRSRYLQSKTGGQVALNALLDSLMMSCPATSMVLVGFSQGAQVVGDDLIALTSEERGRIAAVVLLGDPMYRPGLSYDTADGNDGGGVGVFLRLNRQVPDELAPRLHSYCTKGDPVCNFVPLNFQPCVPIGPNCPHFQYERRRWTDRAANWAIVKWRNLPEFLANRPEIWPN